MTLPQIPECSVELRADGLIHLMHKRTRQTAVADPSDEERVDNEAAILRCLAAWPWTQAS